jgi:6-phosphofructokinase 1
VEGILDPTSANEPQLLGLQQNRIIRSPLVACVQQTLDVAEAIEAKEYERAMAMRGDSFKEALDILQTVVQALPRSPKPKQQRLRLAIINAGSLAPGMNTAVRVATRLGLDKGHTILGIKNGFQGLVDGEIEPLNWSSVAGWASRGGSGLGINRKVPEGSDFYAIARHIEEHNIQGLLVMGGWTAYESVYHLLEQQRNFPVFNIPIICLPSTINNNLPGSELSVGSDTALNNIIEAVDKIKQSAVATQRCFVVEVMGRYCGYLALMTGLATGAEHVYLHEEGVTVRDLQADLTELKKSFQQGKRLGLIIRNEYVSPFYTAGFITSLFEEEGGDLFDVRQTILGHLQRGGDPSPFDRVQATRLAAKCIGFLIEEALAGTSTYTFIGLQGGKVQRFNVEDLPRIADRELQRPKKQWWLALRRIANELT